MPLILALIALLLPSAASAQINFSNLTSNPVSGLSSVGAGGAGGYIQNLITGTQGVKTAFWGIFFAMLTFYGIKLLVGSRDDNTLTETKQAYGQALLGAIVAGGALLLTQAFTTSGTIVEQGSFNQVTNNAVNFFSGLIATLVLANIVIQGIRLVLALEEGDVDKAKKRFIHGAIGGAIAILATAIVRTFTATRTSGGGGISSGGIAAITTEIIGIGQYLTLILGALSVIGIVIAGVMLVVSIDESLKDRARKLIITSLVALTVSLLAYAIVELFINI